MKSTYSERGKRQGFVQHQLGSKQGQVLYSPAVGAEPGIADVILERVREAADANSL